MKQQDFANLSKSIKQAGAIRRGETKASRVTEVFTRQPDDNEPATMFGRPILVEGKAVTFKEWREICEQPAEGNPVSIIESFGLGKAKK